MLVPREVHTLPAPSSLSSIPFARMNFQDGKKDASADCSPINKIVFDQQTKFFNNVTNPTDYDEWFGLHGKEVMFETPTSDDRRTFDPFYVITPVGADSIASVRCSDAPEISCGTRVITPPSNSEMKGAACELFSGIRSGRDDTGEVILNNLHTPQAHNETYKKYRSGKLSLKYGKKVGYSTVEHVNQLVI